MPHVVIPWRPGCEHRERALRFVLDRYAAEHPGWGVTVAEAPPGPWVKALAVTPAVAAAPAGAIVIVADADVWTDGLAAAVGAVEAGVGWAVPHRYVHRLSEGATAALLNGQAWDGIPLAEREYVGVDGGGFVVARRETLLDAPLDPRFVGWGQEDTSWAAALDCLAGGHWRGDADLIHLYHPPQERMTRTRGSRASWALYRRYHATRVRPDAMRALIDEAKETAR